MGTKVNILKLLPILIILVGAFSRLIPHVPNFAPITAITLFGASYLPKKYAFITPLAAMFLSDLVIGFYGVERIFVYGSFALIGILGLWLRKQKSFKNILTASVLSSVIFYLVTNFGVWANPVTSYTKDFSGLISSYIAAIPFFRYTLLSDLTFTLSFFGIYEILLTLNKKYSKI